MVAQLEDRLRVDSSNPVHSSEDVLNALNEIRRTVVEEHNGLFVEMVDELVNKVELFGLHFATLDIRQEASVHTKVLEHLKRRFGVLEGDYSSQSMVEIGDNVAADTLKTIAAIKTIQRENGERGCHRCIISQCRSAENVLDVYKLFLLAGWTAEEITVDIVPLFETIEDLKNAPEVMRRLYENSDYRKHLKRRKNIQTIMLGFSDGTKDGGYLAANWSIYRAKKDLSEVSKEFGTDVIFFDGRGGPPARGGGKTHKFYASMGKEVSDKAIELTVQGQTVSANFGTITAAQFNIEQLLHAGLHKELIDNPQTTFTEPEEELMERLAAESLRSYEKLKEHSAFLDYLVQVSPLRFYSETNIGSRPAKRGSSSKIEFRDLRAIPFVGAWSQLKQNVPGFYGVGSAIKAIDEAGKFERMTELYNGNQFFKALIDNCEMAMLKCDFALTRFLADDPDFGDIWRNIYDEFELTKSYLRKISGNADLMDDYPVERQSILMRERIMLPLVTIQQYALTRLRRDDGLSTDLKNSLEKLIVRCSFGIINAGRNSA